MKRLVALLALSLIPLPVHAKSGLTMERANRLKDADREEGGGAAPRGRRIRPQPEPLPQPKPQPIAELQALGTASPDAAVAAGSDGFLVLAPTGDKLLSYDAAGANESVVFIASGKVDSWRIAEDGSILYATGGKLHVAKIGGDDFEIGAAPVGGAAMSKDGARLAFCADGKLVVAARDGKSRREIASTKGLILCGQPAFSSDGKKVFVLVSDTSATESDGIGVADLGADAASVTRLYAATGATLTSLAVAPAGNWLLYSQMSHAEPAQASLRVLATDASSLHTVARASDIRDASFSMDGAHVYFSAKGAGGRWQAWEAGVVEDAASGEIATRKLAGEADRDFLHPSLAANNTFVFAVSRAADGAKATVVMIKVR